MLAIDTNVVVRYLIGDDAGQAARAKRLVDNNDVFVGTTVMLETEWVLRSVYGFGATRCARAIADFAGLAHVTLEEPANVAQALNWVGQGVDFADGLHLAKAGGCDGFVTFDRKLAALANRLGGVKARVP